MKKLMLVLVLVASVVGMIFAENKLCEVFDNHEKGGIYVNVTSKQVQKKDKTVAEYDNTIKVMSNGNKMRVIECIIKAKYGKNTLGYGETGYILESYGEHTEVFRTAERPLDRSQIYVKAEGCN